MLKRLITILILTPIVFACDQDKQNKRNLHFNIEGLESRSTNIVSYMTTVYIPVYTDVFHIDQSKLFPLTITLSLRNTSQTDTIKIFKVNYYNSEGTLVNQHIDNTSMLRLKPLQSYELVIDKMTYTGDTGANYIVEYGSASEQSDLLVQALMINTSGQQGLSFITEGKVIKSTQIH